MRERPNSAAQILEFWFSDETRAQWFKGTPELDEEICRDFGTLHKLAAAGNLDEWVSEPHGALALIIVLDQFTRNIYRGSARAYENDERARQLCKIALKNRIDRKLDGWHKAFLYMPLMHSEALADQELSVRLFTSAGLENARYAIHHCDIIRRFGRFPHRNAILGRVSSASEIDYLKSTHAFTG